VQWSFQDGVNIFSLTYNPLNVSLSFGRVTLQCERLTREAEITIFEVFGTIQVKIKPCLPAQQAGEHSNHLAAKLTNWVKWKKWEQTIL